MVNHKINRLRTSATAVEAAGGSQYGKGSVSDTGDISSKTTRSSKKDQVSVNTDNEQVRCSERKASSRDAVRESCQSVTQTGNAHEEAHGLLLLAKLSEKERTAERHSRPKRNLKRPAKFMDAFVMSSSPRKFKTADHSNAVDDKTKHDMSSQAKRCLKSPTKTNSHVSGQDDHECNEVKEAFCLGLNLRGKTKGKQSKEADLQNEIKDVKKTNKLKQKKGCKLPLKRQTKTKKTRKDYKALSSEKQRKKPKEKKVGESASLIKQANKTEQKSKKRKVYKKRVSKSKKFLSNSDDVNESEKSLKSSQTEDEWSDKKHHVHVLVDPEVLKSSKTTRAKQTAVPKSNSFTNACVVQFGGKAFVLNTPPSVGELTPDKILHQLLPFVKEKCLDAKDIVIKEIKASTKNVSKDSCPQEKHSMSGIEAILKAVELISTNEKEASSTQCENLGECYLTYPIHSPYKDVSYKTVRMSDLESLEISKTLSKFVDKEHDYSGRKGNNSTPKRNTKAVKDVGIIKGSYGRPCKMLVKGNNLNTEIQVKYAGGSAGRHYKEAKESESKSVSILTETTLTASDLLHGEDSLELEPNSESSKVSTSVKSSNKANSKPVKVFRVVNGKLVDSKKMPDPVRVVDPENWQQFALFRHVSEKCEKCDKTFSSYRELRQHFSTVHKAQIVKLYKCPDCGQEFEVLAYLKRHQLLVHKIGQDLLKPVPAKRETTSEDGDRKSPAVLKPKPKRTLPKCSECKQAFPCAEQLGDHLIRCHSNKVVFSDLILCELCDEVFMLVKDFLVHKRDVHNLNPNMSKIGQNKPPLQTVEDSLQRQSVAGVEESESTTTNIDESESTATNIDESESTATNIDESAFTDTNIEETPIDIKKRMIASEVKGDLLSLMQMTNLHVEAVESNTDTTHIHQSASDSGQNDENMPARRSSCGANPVQIVEDDTELNITNNIVSCANGSALFLEEMDNALPVFSKQLLNKRLQKDSLIVKSFPKTEKDGNLKSLTQGEDDKDVKLFFCDVCNKQVRNLHTHILVHTGEKPFTCTACRLAFSVSTILKMHLKLHTRGYLPFICSVCGKRFKQESDFNQHAAAHGCGQMHPHSKNLQVCLKEQDSSVSQTPTLDGDGKQVSPPQLLVDDDCHEESHFLMTSEIQDVSTDHSYGTNTFRSCSDHSLNSDLTHNSVPQTLKSDSQTLNCDPRTLKSDSQTPNCDPRTLNSDDKALNSDFPTLAESFYRCMICGKVGADLHSHMMTHATEAVNQCNECGQGFTSKLALKDHMSSHRTWVSKKLSDRSADQTVKWHECPYCEKRFLYMQSLHRHLVSHTGVYPRHCVVCSKGFIYPKDMHFHVRSHKGYEDWCPERPTTKDQLAMSNPNISIIECGMDLSTTDCHPSEGGYHICSNCKSRFKNISDVSNHLLFKCHFCGKAYKKSGSIIEHMTVHSDGAYKCHVCESTFQTQSGLRSHKTIHVQGDFQCPHCAKSFVFKSRLNKHLLTHEESKSFECDVCRKRYRYKGDLTKHKIVHESEKRCRCSACPRAFHTHTELKSHSERVHPAPGGGRQLYMCNVCGRESQSYSALKTHIKIHSAVKPYGCEVCEKRFHSKTNRNQHLRVHSEDKPFKCGLCPKQYKSSNALNLHHQVVHEGIRPHSCKICGKSFGEQNKLYLHMRCHTGETPYECSMCDKRFSHKSLLTNHTAIHTGQKKFVCEFCDRSFTQRTNLVVHRRRHTGERPYGCKFCSNSYRTSNALANHVRTHTGEQPFVCDVCPEAFMFKKKLWKHMKVHSSRQPYQCRKCRMIFVVKDNFDKHYQNHIRDEENARKILQAEQERKKRKKSLFVETSSTAVPVATASVDGCGSLIQCIDLPFACGSCPSRFRTVVELRDHNTSHLLQPFQCALCKETFCSPDVLSAHLIKHVDAVTIDPSTPSNTSSISSNHASNQTSYNDKNTNSFTCHICYKSFTHENNLIAHKRIHVCVKPEGSPDTVPVVSAVTSDMSVQTGDSGQVVVVEYTHSGLSPRQELTEGAGYVGGSQESIIIERGVSELEQQPYITIQVPPDYNQNINELISQASDYLDILIKNEITI